jgi:hypothetical protein
MLVRRQAAAVVSAPPRGQCCSADLHAEAVQRPQNLDLALRRRQVGGCHTVLRSVHVYVRGVGHSG